MRSLQRFWALLMLPLLLFNGPLRADEVSAPMKKTEQEALYSAIQGFVGKSWNGSELYPEPCGWTPIQGVSCDLFDGVWYVTALSVGPIMDNSLGCAPDAGFSSHLFQLKHLKTLSFYDCFPRRRQLTPAAIPSQNWEKLAGSLETLEFRFNWGLAGGVPSGIGRLTNLRSLVVVDNGLAGELPQELGNLTRMKRLVMSGNQFSGQVPASLGCTMAELLILDLSRNALTGPLPASLGGLSSLLKLDLSNNLLDGKLPWELGKLRNLTLLDLRNNRLSGGLVSSLQGLASLHELLLSNNPLGGNITDFPWETMRNLTTVDLSNTGLEGVIPESLTNLMGIRFLALDNNHLLGEVPSKLAVLPIVGALYLNGNNLTGQLGFSEEFYKRMGRRFAAWGNPDLCYSSPAASAGHVPAGVQQCRQGQGGPTPSSGPRSNMGGGRTDLGSGLVASCGFSSALVGGLWRVVLLREVVVVLLLTVTL